MPPILETPRLLLRPFEESDIPAAFQLFETHPDVYAYDPGYARSYEDRATRIRRYAQENDPGGLGNLAVTLRGTNLLIGYTGLQFYLLPSLPYAVPEVELFYKFGRDYWGQGYAIEACRAVLVFAFTELRLQHTCSCVVRQNARSLRLLERLGARFEDAPPAWPGDVVGYIENPG